MVKENATKSVNLVVRHVGMQSHGVGAPIVLRMCLCFLWILVLALLFFNPINVVYCIFLFGNFLQKLQILKTHENNHLQQMN